MAIQKHYSQSPALYCSTHHLSSEPEIIGKSLSDTSNDRNGVFNKSTFLYSTDHVSVTPSGSLTNVTELSKHNIENHNELLNSQYGKSTTLGAEEVCSFEVESNVNEISFSTPSVGNNSQDNLVSTKNQSLLIPCIAVYASNYNFSVLAIAMYIMNQDDKYKSTTNNAFSDASVKMLAYAGAVVGQFVMGYLGDKLGRKRAMIFTLLLILLGALGSAVCTWGDALTLFISMGLCRFILGVGSGGVYPLSAVSAAEGTASSKAEDRSPRVSWAYFFNVPGIISPYILAAIVWNSTTNVEVNFRILLGFGALPVLFIIWNAIEAKDSEEFRNSKSKQLFSALFNKHYLKNLIATGVCWFLYDVAAYGILLVQPDITAKIWGAASTVNDVIWQGVVLNSIGIPGALMGILVVKQMGLKMLQFWGFISLAVSSAVMAIISSVLAEEMWLQMLMLAVINFCINWGAAVTTFILPSTVFPPECRSTYNGIAAAMGKSGAIVGIYLCRALLYSAGIAPMMSVVCFVSVLGAILTWFYVGLVPKTCRGALTQCFGSLLACIPFCDLRKKSWR